ncbi:helix-turn-helix domain-containing protein [Treponema zioleckii]|uniref:helix-turn-helix domain-containing protein n=1 Tax=Treponema zioleckii TaxID=331680 RepID=UPI00168ABD51|nr:helix-turn-helix transcriptional regulator [Treponema zioleckii]
MGFGENLHNELVFQDVQIKELSARTGIKKSTLDKYLSGNKSQPSVENAVKIADSLGVTVEYLVKGVALSDINSNLTLSGEYKLLIEQYHQLSDFNKQTVRDLTQSLLKRQKQFSPS